MLKLVDLLILGDLDLERMLLDLGALKESDVRLKKRSDDEKQESEDYGNVEDYDDDWY